MANAYRSSIGDYMPEKEIEKEIKKEKEIEKKNISLDISSMRKPMKKRNESRRASWMWMSICLRNRNSAL